jgi:hypothetical protein
MMSHLVQLAAAKLPTMLGGGILGVSVAGASAALIGLGFGMAAELISAVIGIAVATRFS